MNTKALRQKILDLAIHGKLLPLEKVEQIRKDEPASILLEKIRGEKEEKIAKGELKRNKNDSFIFTKDCEFDEDKLGKQSEGLRHKRHYEKFADGTVKDIEDEIPFEVPEGWCWCRLGEICELKGGKRIPAGLSATKEKTPHIYIRVTDMKNNSISDEDFLYIDEKIFEKIQRYTINKNDLYLTIAGTIGRVGIIPDKFDGMNLTENALKLTDIIINKNFLMNILNTSFVQDYFASTYHQVAMPKLSLINASRTLLPLPPLTEQKLIVEEIEKIFAQIDLLEQNKTDLQTAIKQAKSKILDLAIHGKLVPQDPNDEPASVLLEKIRAEKEEKIAKGELKRDKNDSFIYKSTTDNCHYEKLNGKDVCIEDELPFSIPENWQWCRMGGMCKILMGQSPAGENVSETNDGIEFHQGKIYFTDKYLAHSNIKTSEITRISDKESLLLCVRAPVGVVNITDREICIGRGLCSIKPLYVINIDFWFYWILYQRETLELQATGTTFKAITVDVVKNLLIPLPPLSEQKRIVAKIEELFSLLDQIQTNLI